MTDRINRVQSEIEQVIAKYVMRLLWTIIGIAFAGGVWATKMQNDISNTRAAVERVEMKVREHEELLQTNNRNSEQWRNELAKWQADFEKRLAAEMSMRTNQRFTTVDYDKAVWVQRNSVDKLLPYFAELKLIGKAHN